MCLPCIPFDLDSNFPNDSGRIWTEHNHPAVDIQPDIS